MIYADASALVKLVIDEPEAAALRRAIGSRAVATSELSRVEVTRAVLRGGAHLLQDVQDTLARVDLVPLLPSVLDHASTIEPAALRSLDAIHLAAALRFRDVLEAVVTYDRRMAEAARSLGLPVEAPA